MRKERKLLITIIFAAVLILLGTVKSNAGNLSLNNLNFNVQIKDDGSMDVVETWNIYIQNTNTLYKTFKTDKDKYSGITNVKVTDITDETPISLRQTDQWAYHVQKGYYYGTKNNDGNFEIGWGVGLDASAEIKTYQITYTVKDAIAKYNDYAELYWQFVGSDFEINARKITGTIYLPGNAPSKDDIKVWGHSEGLNGTIYATAQNKIEFDITAFKSGRYIEIRTLFPPNLINSTGRTKNSNIYEKVVKEETKWANKANRQRWIAENSGWILVLIIILVFGGVFLGVLTLQIKQTKKYKKRLKELENQEKFFASIQYKYFRDIPDENTTPGEVIRILKPIKSQFTSFEFGKIFSATILDLSLKQYLEVKMEKNEKNKDITNIYVLKQVTDELKPSEGKIMTFIRDAAGKKKVITLKELQRYIKDHPTKVESMVNSTFRSVENQLNSENILDLQAYKEYSSYSEAQIGHVVLVIVLCWFAFAIVPIIGVIVAAINAVLCGKLKKKINILTQNGVDKQAEWKGLKIFMEEFSMLDKREVPELVIWEKYLVYATAMGIADKVIKQLKIVYPNFEEMTNGINTYTYMNLMMNTNFSSGFSSAIDSSISSARASYSSTYSSGSGGGGGFSGGGGGGRRWRRPEDN